MKSVPFAKYKWIEVQAGAIWRLLVAIGILGLLVLVIAGLLAVTRPVMAGGPTYVHGPIEGPETWTGENSPYIVTGTITILDTGSLTIEPGVEVRFRLETGLVAEGLLAALGSPTAPITFTTDLEPAVFNAWDGVRLVGSGNTLQHCLVEYGYYGLYIYPGSDHNLVADSQFWLNGHWEGPAGGTILGSTDYSQFLRNMISNSPFGILLLESSHNTIAGNEIGFLDDVAIGLHGTASSYGTGNVITGNFSGRLVGEGLSLLYQSNVTVSGNHLYQTANGSSGALGRSAATVTGPLNGILVDLPIAGGLSVRSSDRVTMTGNTVTESGWGDAPTYRAGVYISGTTNLLFDGNLVYLNMGDGLEYAAANGSSPFIHNNGFWDNEGLEIESFFPSSLDVSGNWWGTDAPLPGAHLSGTLVYTPWVTLALAADPTVLPANGLAQAELTVTMLDGTGYHAPDGMVIDLESSLGWLFPTQVSLASGAATAHLTAPSSPGTAWLTATAPLPPPGMTTTIPLGRQAFAQVSFVIHEAQTLTLTAAPAVIQADGVSTSTLNAEVLDPMGSPVDDGTVVVFSTTLGTLPGGLPTTREPTGMMTVEAESGDVVKTGDWLPYSDPSASAGGGIFSREAGDIVTYTFTGTAVSVLFQRQSDAGIARVYLDGIVYREVDTYDPGVLYQQEELIAEALAYAPHILEVEVTGNKNPASSDAYLVVDAVRIYGHERNDAYLTSGGISSVTLTSAITPGFALASACAGPACDSAWIRFRLPGANLLYLPIVRNTYPPQPVPDCIEVIGNGGFENDTAWIFGVTPRPARYTTEQAHSGVRSVLLGIKPGESDVRSYSSVRQMVTLDAGASSATLAFWFFPVSDQDGGDRQECLLLDEEGDPLATLMQTNANTGAWTLKSYDLSAYAGQTIGVYFNAYNDGGGDGVTGFYLDDVSLQTCTAK